MPCRLGVKVIIWPTHQAQSTMLPPPSLWGLPFKTYTTSQVDRRISRCQCRPEISEVPCSHPGSTLQTTAAGLQQAAKLAPQLVEPEQLPKFTGKVGATGGSGRGSGNRGRKQTAQHSNKIGKAQPVSKLSEVRGITWCKRSKTWRVRGPRVEGKQPTGKIFPPTKKGVVPKESNELAKKLWPSYAGG